MLAVLLVTLHAMLLVMLSMLLVGLATLYVLLMMGLSATTFHRFRISESLNGSDDSFYLISDIS